MIKVLRASAGSGKTFNLAKTYIRLLMQSSDRYAYRHILAVTFTNKATSEMKNRIIKELDILSREPERSGYIKEFAALCGGVEPVKQKAERLIRDILHDYAAFSVNTIDKFFVQALRAFAMELGQFSRYQIELDRESLVQECVDRVLDGLDNTPAKEDLRSWLRDSIKEDLENKGSFGLERKIGEMAKRLMSDELRDALEKRGFRKGFTFSRDYLKKVRQFCREYNKTYLSRIASASKKVMETISACGLSPENFSRANTFTLKIGVIGDCAAKGSFVDPSPTLLDSAVDAEKWFRKNEAGKYLPMCQEALEGPMNAFADLFSDDNLKVFKTVQVLNKQINSLGLASDIDTEYALLLNEKNVISLDDSNTTIRNIIAGTDAPFIYEKLGVRYENFLLDEFQDTSAIQWDNFVPLIKESDSSGGFNLIVGDVKQSIYRWRGGDWKLLSSGVKENFPGIDANESLRQNWRSLKTIVEFNSAFFPYAAQMLDAKAGSGDLIKGIYADASQEARTRNPAPGFVNFTFCEEKEEEYGKILESLNRALQAGASYGQTAILVRTNNDGSDIASFLLKNDIPVISDDSMRVKSCETVRRLVSLLSCVCNEGDSLNTFIARELDIELPSRYDTIYSLAEDLLRRLGEKTPEIYGKDVLYIQSFMDVIQDWSASNGNSIMEFLRYWDKEDPKIASPEGVDSVRIMTIHKSKGLEFDYVIVPFMGERELYSRNGEQRWCVPYLEGTPLEGKAEGVYNVTLTSGMDGTFFSKQYREELKMQYIDTINTFYVAFTRARRVLEIISTKPDKKAQENLNPGGFKRFADVLYSYLESQDQSFGEMYDFKADAYGKGAWSDESLREGTMEAEYRTWPLRGRLRIGGDAAELFARAPGDESLPARIKGIVMHKILSDVSVASDLPSAVERAVAGGLVAPSERQEYLSLLEAKLSEVESLGWFLPGGEALNEISILAPDGTVHRPDRVTIGPDNSVTVIDYKFGEPHSGYAAQIRRYCDLYRKMGYTKVQGWLWYVTLAQTVKVE